MALSVASPTEGTLQIAGAVVIGTLDGSGNFQQYVGPSYKSPCRAATTANITIATGLNPGDVIDTVTLAANDRVLVKNQSTPSQNGIYVVGVVPARATDMDEWSEVPGAVVGVTEGSAAPSGNADTAWLCTSNAGGTIGSTAINFSSFGASFDQNNVAITGGTINGTPIGGTTPAAVTATTVTVGNVVSYNSGSDGGWEFNGIRLRSSGAGDLYLANGGGLAMEGYLKVKATGFLGFTDGAAYNDADLKLLRDSASTLRLGGAATTDNLTLLIPSLATDPSNYRYGKFYMNDTGLEISVDALGAGVGDHNITFIPGGAGGLYLRNGTNAPNLFIYKTTDGGSNYERLEVGAVSGAFYLTTRGAGTGVARGIKLGSEGDAPAILRTNGNDRVTVAGDGELLIAVGDITFSAVSKGPVVKSPDGNRWRLEVDNAGVLNAVDLDP